VQFELLMLFFKVKRQKKKLWPRRAKDGNTTIEIINEAVREEAVN
jgi:hypothetical protein